LVSWQERQASGLGAEPETVEVGMMRSTENRRYMADAEAGFEAVEIPYRAMSLLVGLTA
jgi:serine protease inhibitor